MNNLNCICRILRTFPVYITGLLLFVMAGGCGDNEAVKNKAPTCSITSPVNGAELLKGEIKTIAVAAADADGHITEVIFRIDGIIVDTILSLPFQYLWNTSDATAGLHTINVTVKDDSKNEISREIGIMILEDGGSVPETGTVDDYDGNRYITVKIGRQWWMAENLKTTHYPDGSEITLIRNTIDWANLGFSDKAFCYYNDSINYNRIYGALYTWAAAMNGSVSSESTSSNVQGVCPAGWHLPSDGEWIILEMELGMSYDEAWLVGWRGTNEGAKMKTKVGWDSNGNGTNSSGFSALPAGIRSGDGQFSDAGRTTHFWSSTEYFNITSFAFNRNLDYNQSGVGWFRASHYYGYPKDFGFSVRCVKD